MKYVTKLVEVDAIKPYEKNPRKNQNAVEAVAESIREFGFRQPLVCNRELVIIVGHTRWKAARMLGLEKIPVHVVENLTPPQERALRIADNRTGEIATWDDELLAEELRALFAEDYQHAPLAFSDDEIAKLLNASGDGLEQAGASLAERFGITPLSILDARSGTWRKRKDAWLSIGIKSEVGRGEQITFSKSCQPPEVYDMKRRMERKDGRKLSWDEFLERSPEARQRMQAGVSIFDPVLCELAYRWFCPPDGLVLDPFAGGSVRGIVAALTGRRYIGVDLRKEQIEANVANWREVSKAQGSEVAPPEWHAGDSINVGKYIKARKADLLFSCPPYADLEVYSDDPADLSTMSYRMFRQKYREIIKHACAHLRDDRFAVFVVGEVRDKNKRKGFYNFVGDTVAAFRDAGLEYYNEAVLLTPFGSAITRAASQFEASRKLCRVHQDVLVFVKGDPAAATKAVGVCDFGKVDASAEVCGVTGLEG